MASAPLLFLSHAGDEAPAAREIARRLREAGLGIWLDIEELKPGDRWMEALEGAIARADAFAVYVGRSGVAHWVDREVRLALARNTRDASFRVIPILGPGADPKALPPFLAQHQWLDLRSGEVVDLQKLVGAILRQRSAEIPLLPPDQPPFRGLLAFDVEHALLFFGRDREVEDLLEGLRRERFLAVVGDSGSGKSSLVRAGVLPALHRGRFHDGGSWADAWRVAIFRPADDPFREMGNSLPDLDPGLSPAQRMDVLDSCRRRLGEGTGGLYDCVVTLVPRGARALIVVDQFEELFTTGSDPVARRRFIDSLLRATEGVGDHPTHVVITLRADFYSRCWEHPELPNRVSRNLYAVRRMDREHLQEAIERPLALAGARLESGLLDTILSEIGDEPGNLPLLEHALLQLWQRRVGAALTHEVYQGIGRLSGALDRQADQVLASLGAEDLVRRLFTRLVRVGRPSEASADTRARVYLDELDPALQQISGALAAPEARLVVRARDASTGRETVELAHEALINGWRRLGSWLTEDREFLLWRQRVAAALHEWRERGREPEGLLRGSSLSEAERWVQARGSELSVGEFQYVREAGSASRRASRRRQLLKFSAVSAVVVFAAITSLLWRNSEVSRRQSERILANADFKEASLLSAEGRSDDALAYLARAARLDATNPAVMSRIVTELMAARRPLPVAAFWHDAGVNVVRFSPTADRVATSSRDRVVRVWAVDGGGSPTEIRGHTGDVLALAFSPAGRQLATFSADGTARIWSLPSGAPVGRPLELGAAGFALFSPDGRRLLTASEDGLAHIWNSATGDPMGVPMHHGARVHSAHFSRDAQLVVTASEDRTARVWDVESGRPLSEPLRHGRRVWSAELSPDGTKVVTGSADRTAQIWETRSGRRIAPPIRHGTGEMWASHFSPDGRLLMTVSGGTLQLRSASDGRPLGNVIKHEGGILAACFSPDGRTILTASSDRTAQLWDAASSAPIGRPMRHYGAVGSVEFSSDGARVLTSSGDRSVRVWDVTPSGIGGQVHPHLGPVIYAEVSGDGRLIATASGDHTARVWDVRSGQGGRPLMHWAPVNSVRFDPDGRRVVTSAQDGTARIWDSWSGQALTQPVQLGANVIDSRFLHDGRIETVLSLLEDGTTRQWAVTSGQLVRTIEAPSPRPQRIKLSENGNYVIGLLADRTAYVRDVRGGHEVRRKGALPVERATGVETSGDGRRALTIAEDGSVRVWDIASGEDVGLPLHHPASIDLARFSPDGRYVFAASYGGEARLWNVATGQPLSQLSNQPYSLSGAVFSHDGKRVAAFQGSSAVVWDVNTGQPLTWPLAHQTTIRSASFSPDGQRLLVVSGCAAWLWDVPVGQAEDAQVLADLAEALSGYGFAGGGTMVPLRDQTVRLRRLRENSITIPGPCQFAWCFTKWMLVEPCCSRISPLSTQSVATYIKTQADYRAARNELSCWR